MIVLVVENERPAAERLINLIKSLDGTMRVAGVIETVEGAVNWLKSNPEPDLIMMDIQLDDGLCFEIFEIADIKIPVIFTTAYDEYTLQAFRVYSVDYLLKPVTQDKLKEALGKFRKFYLRDNQVRPDFNKILMELGNQYKSRFLVRAGERYRSVPVSEISYFHIIERSVFLKDIRGKEYALDYSLEQLQNILDPGRYFRINRDCIVSIDSVSTIYSYSSSRLILNIETGDKDEKFIVSRERVADFKRWIDR